MLAHVSPILNVGATVKIGSDEPESSIVTGVGEDYIAIRSYSMKEGRFLQYIDILRRQKVCVIGSYIADTYYSGSGVGETLKINGNTFVIVGVLNEKRIARKAAATTESTFRTPSLPRWRGRAQLRSLSSAAHRRKTWRKPSP